MMTGTKFDIEKFDGKNDFGLWHVRMKALLKQHGLAAALEELLAATIVAYDSVIRKKSLQRIDLVFEWSVPTGDHQGDDCSEDLEKSEHIDEFHNLVGDLAAIDIAISDEDQALLLLTSLPLSYNNFLESFLYGWDTLKLEDSEEHLKRDCPRYNHKRSQGFVKNEVPVSGSRADGYDSADVMMAMSVEELLDWIMDLGGSCHITHMRDYLIDFEEYDGDTILHGDGRECRVHGTS
nr:retrovirus-related Pol polyprotein from transposon TNT 1-94 [Tanacetum cinerariifolium]GEX72410.1 retrovirus-related Pol polyprotein from transposon TNT 1-94 [Tanacetum cinerariifolium]